MFVPSSFVRSFVLVSLRSFVRSFVLVSLRSLVRSFIRSLVTSFIPSSVCSSARPPARIYRLPDVSMFCFNFLDKLLHFRNRGKDSGKGNRVALTSETTTQGEIKF